MGTRRAKVLVVDDDDGVALAIHRALYLAHDPFDIILSRTAEAARQIMREVHIDGLVTDVHLPRMSGLDLIAWASVEAPETRLVVMTGQDLSDIREKLRAAGAMRLLPKPVEINALRAVVREAIDASNGLTGRLSALSMVDLIQMLCMGQKTSAIAVENAEHTGALMVRDGAIVHAVWDELVGEAAFAAIISAMDGTFNLQPFPDGCPTSIRRDWRHVLMDAVRSLDEAANGDSEDPPESYPAIRPSPESIRFFAMPEVPLPEVQVQVKPPPAKAPKLTAATMAEAARLIDRGFAALRDGLVNEARGHWTEALRLDPSNRAIETNLRKLDNKRG